jgi:hypothetical protein
MANVRQSKSVTLEELVIGKLPERLLSALNKTELTVADLARWEASKPALHIMASDSHLIVDLKLRLPIKKMLVVIGGFVGFGWTLTTLIVNNLPQIQTAFHLK